jgi:hypothetical protein
MSLEEMRSAHQQYNSSAFILLNVNINKLFIYNKLLFVVFYVCASVCVCVVSTSRPLSQTSSPSSGFTHQCIHSLSTP